MTIFFGLLDYLLTVNATHEMYTFFNAENVHSSPD